MDIIANFRTILFNTKYSLVFVRAIFDYFDYIFANRGCMAINWGVAIQNEYALKQYDRFINRFFGHIVGIRHHAVKSYTGKRSDLKMYEITREEYFEWKERDIANRNGHGLQSG